jgi:hypothetical protein
LVFDEVEQMHNKGSIRILFEIFCGFSSHDPQQDEFTEESSCFHFEVPRTDQCQPMGFFEWENDVTKQNMRLGRVEQETLAYCRKRAVELENIANELVLHRRLVASLA